MDLANQADSMIAASGVELVGLPGAGKSTVYRQLRALARGDLRIEFPQVPSLQRSRAVLRDLLPELAERSEEFFAPGRLPGQAGLAEVVALEEARRLWFGRAALVASAYETGRVAVFEESTIHETWRLAVRMRRSPRSDAALAPLWRAVPLCGTVVHLTAADPVRFERFQSKTTGIGPVNQALLDSGPTGGLWREATSWYAELLGSTRLARCALVPLPNERDGHEQAVAHSLLERLNA